MARSTRVSAASLSRSACAFASAYHIVGDDDKLGLLLLYERRHVLHAELQDLGLRAFVGLLALRLGSGRLELTYLLLLLRLRTIFAQKGKQSLG